ncbi:PstS family phosphate ABC transporter substrate-binding protein [Oceanobacillus sp. CFH 90083]|uniref:PstS family phosphate ABC transporter substrate-binding protein n=1 Tax=Oceanobacillus sp. CFH 90083 TaxID=2592336 RepID=UPI00128E124A|nr:PstS family phosphate ABC transporter substrate-binding protein [Oceanobacillus sp. CFH 90083]
MSFKRFTLFFFVSTLIFLAACGGSDDADSAGDSESGGSEELSGSVAIDGSGTVYPLMARLAEEYMINEQQGVSVEVSRAGTSAGFEKFLIENGTDFNDASREIKEEEQAKADELGIEVQELKVALDGLTIVTHPGNDWATELTPEQVQGIFLGEYKQWSDIDDSWPSEDIKTYGPNENHGTYEFFYEEILEEQDLAEGIDLQQDYSTLVTLISEDENAIGFFGFGYYQSNQDTINAVSIDFGEGAVEPSLDTIAEDGPYADYTRPVFTYLNVNHAQEKPEVLDYAKYVLENTNNFAGETGFAPIPDEEAASQLEALEGIE